MPRRISDYADAFAGWNLVSSFGSLVSVVATWIFLDILYKQLTTGNATSRYPWLSPQFYVDILRALLERSYDSIEWGLNSPPRPHAFVSLPIQSMPTEIILIIGQFLDPIYSVHFEPIVANVLNTFEELGSMKDNLLSCTYMDYPWVDAWKSQYFSEQTSEALDIARRDIHSIATSEINLKTLNALDNELFNKTYTQKIDDRTIRIANLISDFRYSYSGGGHDRTSTVLDMVRKYESTVAQREALRAFAELPFPIRRE